MGLRGGFKGGPHRHFVFSIPKILRRYFLYDLSLLSGLSRYVWGALRLFFQESVPQTGAVPGAVVAIQRFGDFFGLGGIRGFRSMQARGFTLEKKREWET